MTPADRAPNRALTLRSAYAALAGVLLLIALGLAWESTIAPLRPGGSWLILKVLPLALLVAPLMRRSLRAFQTLSLVIQIYVGEGALRVASDPLPIGRTLAGIELALALGVFAVTLIHVRARRGAASA